MRSRSWRLRNLLTTSAPKVKETPRSFSPQPCTSLSGSDHNRSHNRPERHTQRQEMYMKSTDIQQEFVLKLLYSGTCSVSSTQVQAFS